MGGPCPGAEGKPPPGAAPAPGPGAPMGGGPIGGGPPLMGGGPCSMQNVKRKQSRACGSLLRGNLCSWGGRPLQPACAPSSLTCQPFKIHPSTLTPIGTIPS
eukprot:1162118-Pelagomonas_calceolata.AAC.9